MPSGRKTRQRTESEVDEHVKKALLPVETAPKQKHVRACIMFCWDFQGSEPVWRSIIMQPLLGDSIVCWKALILIHKILVGGPHVVLSEAIGHCGMLERCSAVHSTGFGYGPLIRAYVPYILGKIDFHQVRPQFTGNFDYEEYLSVRGVSDPDAGWETIGDLMDVQERLSNLHSAIMGSFNSANASECRVAALVPVVEETWGVHKFVTSMLSAMFAAVECPDALLPLVERYRDQYRTLRKFYSDCSQLRHLCTIVSIPKLADEPPMFKTPMMQPQQTLTPVIKAPQEKPKTPIPQSFDLLGDIQDGEDDDPFGIHAVHEEVHVTEIIVDETALAEANMRISQLLAVVRSLEERVYQLGEVDTMRQRKLAEAALRNEELERKVYNLQLVIDSANLDAAKEVERNWQLKYDRLCVEAAQWKRRCEEQTKTRPDNKDVVREGIEGAADIVRAAENKLKSLRYDDSHNKLSESVHSSIVNVVERMTVAVGTLIEQAIKTQKEFEAKGRKTLGEDEFYKKHSEWTNGLISAAYSVAHSTALLVEMADGLIKGIKSVNHLIAASNGVAAATAQLVTASRVGSASFESLECPLLEESCSTVVDANKNLIKAIADLGINLNDETESENLLHSSVISMKVDELERQARVLSLERQLGMAREGLANLRKAAYDSPEDSIASSSSGSSSIAPNDDGSFSRSKRNSLPSGEKIDLNIRRGLGSEENLFDFEPKIDEKTRSIEKSKPSIGENVTIISEAENQGELIDDPYGALRGFIYRKPSVRVDMEDEDGYSNANTMSQSMLSCVGGNHEIDSKVNECVKLTNEIQLAVGVTAKMTRVSDELCVTQDKEVSLEEAKDPFDGGMM